MNDEIQTRFVIGGPARCGKTTLSTAIADTDESCFVLGVDALFRAILRRGIVNRVTPVADTVAHFLTRQRFQDAERSIAESPLDYSPLDLDALIGASTGANPVTAYASALDAMAVAAGKTTLGHLRPASGVRLPPSAPPDSRPQAGGDVPRPG